MSNVDPRTNEPPPPQAWFVLIEETVSYGQAQRWGVTSATPVKSREQGRRAAEKFAHEYQPGHPTFPQGRTIYCCTDDQWFVVVPGATNEYHFRVTVVERVAVVEKD